MVNRFLMKWFKYTGLHFPTNLFGVDDAASRMPCLKWSVYYEDKHLHIHKT